MFGTADSGGSSICDATILEGWKKRLQLDLGIMSNFNNNNNHQMGNGGNQFNHGLVGGAEECIGPDSSMSPSSWQRALGFLSTANNSNNNNMYSNMVPTSPNSNNATNASTALHSHLAFLGNTNMQSDLMLWKQIDDTKKLLQTYNLQPWATATPGHQSSSSLNATTNNGNNRNHHPSLLMGHGNQTHQANQQQQRKGANLLGLTPRMIKDEPVFMTNTTSGMKRARSVSSSSGNGPATNSRSSSSSSSKKIRREDSETSSSENHHPVSNAAQKQLDMVFNNETHGIVRVKSDDGKYGFECLACNKVFGYKQHLVTHISTVHLKLKPHKCDLCDKRFGEKSALTKHIKTVHAKSRPFKCKCCGASFGQKAHLKKHQTSKYACSQRQDDDNE